MDRPITTLFLLQSVDGKISTGSNDSLDFDKDIPNIKPINKGLYQYYNIEQTTDLWSLNSGRVQEKMGVNNYLELPDKTPVSFVVIDNFHLTKRGVEYFCAKSEQFVLITANRKHPAYDVDKDNIHIIFGKGLEGSLKELKKLGCDRLTIQTGGTLNGLLLRVKLIDYVDIVVAPLLVGGKEVSTLIDGPSITNASQLSKLGVLSLIEVVTLQNSYLRLRYKVIG